MPWNSNAPGAGFSGRKPWLPIPDEHAALAVNAQNGDPASQLALTRALISLRGRHDALLTGDAAVLVATETLLVISRRSPGERLLCVFNLGAAAAEWSPNDHGAWRILTAVNGASLWRFPPLSGLIAQAPG